MDGGSPAPSPSLILQKCVCAAESNEKLFSKLLKGQPSTTQMNTFQIDGELIIDKMIFVICALITFKT